MAILIRRRERYLMALWSPHRWLCAKEACQTPGAEGVWAGVLIPAEGRGRRFALKQLGSLADRNGRPLGM